MRVKRGVKGRRSRNRILGLAKGFQGRSKNTIRQATSRVNKAMQYMYRDRKKNKSNFRSLWITRINAAARLLDLTYGQLMSGLRNANVEIDRKMLAMLGSEQPDVFKAVSDVAKKHIQESPSA